MKRQTRQPKAGPTTQWRGAGKAFGDKVKAAGLKLYVWTVDDVELAKQMIAAGAESITTNKPGWLREQLAK